MRTLRRGEYSLIFKSAEMTDDVVANALLGTKRRSDRLKTLARDEEQYLTFVSAARSMDASGCDELAEFQRGIRKAWELSSEVRAQVWSRRRRVKAPGRERSSRAKARAALERLEQAGDRLADAQTRAGVRVAPERVGENRGRQAMAFRSDQEAALNWIEAEIDWLNRYEDAIRADQAARVLNVPRGGFPAADDDLFAELRNRVSGLEALRARLTVASDTELDRLKVLREQLATFDD